jgi:nucleoside-diphosphate-sugar epimerase
MPAPRLLSADLEQIVDRTRECWEQLRGGRLFLTGGTGFFGVWLLESLLWANDRLGLNAQVVLLTRDPAGFGSRLPHLATHRAVTTLQGSLADFEFPSGGFTHVVHAAIDASPQIASKTPLRMLDSIVDGTRRVLELASRSASPKFLFTSSGAVYGPQPAHLERIPDDYDGGPNSLHLGATYGLAKRMAEHLCLLYHRHHGVEATIARAFAFVGPHLPLDQHFAIGNFLRDALEGRPIEVLGDGTTVRSYLYAADLAVWLWTILFRGTPGSAYNVGSEQGMPLAETARIVAQHASTTQSIVIRQEANPARLPARYVPETAKAREHLGLVQFTTLDEALTKTLEWQAPRRQTASAPSSCRLDNTAHNPQKENSR